MKYLIFALLILITSCKPGRKSNPKEKTCFPDSLFVADTSSASVSLSEIKSEGIFDASYKNVNLKKLDSIQKVKLLKPFITNGFPTSDFIAHFVTKQNKIGDMQPITIRVLGTDYQTLWLLLLDKNCKPISQFFLEGENCEGPWETDSTIMDCPTKTNEFKGNSIESIEIRVINFTDNSNRIIIDSLFYDTKISESGMFSTRKVDSVRRVTKKYE